MGEYWNGGVWAPINYMVVEGLKKNGYNDLAVKLSCRYLEALSEVYKKTGTLWETHSPDIYSPATNASGIYMVQPDFVGWTGLGPISMLIETIIRYRTKCTIKYVNLEYIKSIKTRNKTSHVQRWLYRPCCRAS